jgi:hypothetical protein
LQLAAQRIEAEALGQQAHEGFLHHVGGGVARTAAQQRKAVQRTLVAPVQRREGVCGAAAHGAQQVGVEGGGSGCHGQYRFSTHIPPREQKSSRFFADIRDPSCARYH